MVSHKKKILPQKSGKHNIVKMEKINKQMCPFLVTGNTVSSGAQLVPTCPFVPHSIPISQTHTDVARLLCGPKFCFSKAFKRHSPHL